LVIYGYVRTTEREFLMAQARLAPREAWAIINAIQRKVDQGYVPPGHNSKGKPAAISEALRELYPDIPRGSIHTRYIAACNSLGRPRKWPEMQALTFPVFPDGRVPTEELIDRMSADFERRKTAEDARKWFDVKVNIPGPIGIAWLGDPHVDDDGCNWPLLRHDIDIIKHTYGMFGANIGDSENNWAGRLAHLYSQQSTSRETAKQLVEWLFSQSGVEWIVLLLGNHDAWNGNADALSRIERGGSPLADWSAQFKLRFPNGRSGRVWASHDFPGHSQWNPLHGAQKAAKFTGLADLYICGHKHNWSLFQGEDEHRGDVYWLARARGYKHMDEYGHHLGFGSQKHGSTIVSIFDPDATGPGFLTCFADVAAAAEYLIWLRAKRGF